MSTLPSCKILERVHNIGGHTVLGLTVLVQIDEVAKYKSEDAFIEGFSAHELALCQGHRKGEHSLAARYAAKRAAEALIGEPWQSFEVVRYHDQPPSLQRRGVSERLDHHLEGSNLRALLSLTHDEPIAAAHLVIMSPAV